MTSGFTGRDGRDGRGVEKDSLTELVLYGGTTDELRDATDYEHDEQCEADEL